MGSNEIVEFFLKDVSTSETDQYVTSISFVLDSGYIAVGEWPDMQDGNELYLRINDNTFPNCIAHVDLSEKSISIKLNSTIDPYPKSRNYVINFDMSNDKYTDLKRAASNLLSRYPDVWDQGIS